MSSPEEKWEARQKKYEAQDERRKKRQERRNRNIVAVVGFVLAANGLIISFTGWHVWLSIAAFVCCLIGIGRKRPSDWKKTLALVGMAMSLVAVINAVRVSNQWLAEQQPIEQTIEQMMEEAADQVK